MPDGQALADYAKTRGIAITDMFGMSSICVPSPLQIDELARFVSLPSYTVLARFGESGESELVVSAGPPEPTELFDLRKFAPSPTVEVQIDNAPTGLEIVKQLEHSLHEVEIRFSRNNWVRTEEAIVASIDTDWVAIAERLIPGVLHVEGQAFELLSQAGLGAHSVLLPAVADDENAPEVVGALYSVADAMAWRNIAVGESWIDGDLCVALHRDQRSTIPLRLDDARGGVALWAWLGASPDANRGEALQHVLRMSTIVNEHRLPAARAAASLAERQRIAITREHAAEVQRAISDSYSRAAVSLETASRAFDKYREDISKASQATVVAALGLVAFLARNSDALPSWLVVISACVAAFSIVTIGVSRWGRLGDQEGAIERLALDMSNDPLLPAVDKKQVADSLSEFGVRRRARRGRQVVVLMSALGLTVISASTGWLVLRAPGDEVIGAQARVYSGYLIEDDEALLLCERIVEQASCGGLIGEIIGVDLDTARATGPVSVLAYEQDGRLIFVSIS